MTPCQPTGTGAEVFSYFAPSIHQIAITNDRLEALDNRAVTFRFKARGSNEWTTRTLPAEAFLRRFLQHVLPKKFSKVRSYGDLSPSRRTSLTQFRMLLATCPSNAPVPASGQHRERQAGNVVALLSSWCVSRPLQEGHPHGREGAPASQTWSPWDMALIQAYATGQDRLIGYRWSAPAQPLASSSHHCLPKAHALLHDGRDAVMRYLASPLPPVCTEPCYSSAAPPIHCNSIVHATPRACATRHCVGALRHTTSYSLGVFQRK
jgi:hypothetical protein